MPAPRTLLRASVAGIAAYAAGRIVGRQTWPDHLIGEELLGSARGIPRRIRGPNASRLDDRGLLET
jgi:hypothetical protein